MHEWVDDRMGDLMRLVCLLWMDGWLMGWEGGWRFGRVLCWGKRFAQGHTVPLPEILRLRITRPPPLVLVFVDLAARGGLDSNWPNKLPYSFLRAVKFVVLFPTATAPFLVGDWLMGGWQAKENKVAMHVA